MRKNKSPLREGLDGTASGAKYRLSVPETLQKIKHVGIIDILIVAILCCIAYQIATAVAAIAGSAL